MASKKKKKAAKVAKKKAPKASKVSAKGSSKKTCGTCRKPGHNARTCGRAD